MFVISNLMPTREIELLEGRGLIINAFRMSNLIMVEMIRKL